jgi:hypothetical protein
MNITVRGIKFAFLYADFGKRFAVKIFKYNLLHVGMIVISTLNDLQMSESSVYGSYLNWWTIGIPVFKYNLLFFHK